MVVLEMVAKETEHLETTFLYSVNGDAQPLSDFSVMQPLLIAEVEQLLVFLWQLSDGSVQTVKCLLLNDCRRQVLLDILFQF